MAWIQLGSRKINSANICYMEQSPESVLIFFHGQWPGNPLEVKAEEAAALWRHLKAEDPSAARDKGSTMVVPKRVSAPMPVASEAPAKPAEEKPRSTTPAPSGGHQSSSSSSPQRSSSSHSHSQSHSHSKPASSAPGVK